MSSIFQLTTEQLSLKRLVESGELTEEMVADTLEGMDHELDQKIESYCHVINAMNADLLTIDNEITRLKTLQYEKKNQVTRVKRQLTDGLQRIGKTKFDTGLFKGHIRKGVESVKITDDSWLPSDFISEKITVSVDKNGLKKWIKEGNECQGVELVAGDSSLIIK